MSSISFHSFYPFKTELKPLSTRFTKLSRCSFKTIPPPCKFVSEGRVYQLYGDIVVMEKNGVLSFDSSLLNKFKAFKEVQITKLQNQNFATIFPESKKVFEPYDWVRLIENLRQAGNLDSLEWVEIINNFCIKAKLAIDLSSSGENLIDEKEKEQFKQITMNSKEKKAKLIEAYPCLLFKTSLKQNSFNLSEISLNERFMTEIGYSMDTFSSSILQEGLSQIMPHEEKVSLEIIKTFMENCFEIKSCKDQVLEFDSVIFMKCGYVKKIKLQIHFLPTYENGFFELEQIFVIASKGIPYFDENKIPSVAINRDFWENMTIKERDLCQFLQKYYNRKPSMRYTHLNKICRIQELKTKKCKFEK